MSYVDGYILPIPKRRLRAYRRMAEIGRKMWTKHGAVDYKECAGDDLAAKWGTPFTRLLKLKPHETAVFLHRLQVTGPPRSRQRESHERDERDGRTTQGHAVRHQANGLRRIQDAGRVMGKPAGPCL